MTEMMGERNNGNIYFPAIIRQVNQIRLLSQSILNQEAKESIGNRNDKASKAVWELSAVLGFHLKQVAAVLIDLEKKTSGVETVGNRVEKVIPNSIAVLAVPKPIKPTIVPPPVKITKPKDLIKFDYYDRIECMLSLAPEKGMTAAQIVERLKHVCNDSDLTSFRIAQRLRHSTAFVLIKSHWRLTARERYISLRKPAIKEASIIPYRSDRVDTPVNHREEEKVEMFFSTPHFDFEDHSIPDPIVFSHHANFTPLDKYIDCSSYQDQHSLMTSPTYCPFLPHSPSSPLQNSFDPFEMDLDLYDVTMIEPPHFVDYSIPADFLLNI